MIKHTQTIVQAPGRTDGHDAAGRPGDSWRTAIACITDAESVEDVPHFVELDEQGKGHWYFTTLVYLQNLYGEETRLPWRTSLDGVEDLPEYMIGVGPSPRGPFDHAVIIDRNMELVHDPHPSRAGLTSISEIHRIVKP